MRVDDPQRRPRSYTELLHTGQVVAFAKDVDTGLPCDASGRQFGDPSAGTCLVFDSVAEARAYCETAVRSSPSVRFDVFDSEARVHPPVLTVLHPSREAVRDSNPRAMRYRRVIAWLLIVGSVPTMAYAYFMVSGVDAILPGFIGINMLIAGGRVLWYNLGIRETERERQERLDRLER